MLSSQPNNYLVNTQYAEILYSLGNSGENLDSLMLARKYYSNALTLQDDQQSLQTRALWGLLRTCRTIEHQLKKEDEKNTEIIKVCQAKLKEIYSCCKNIDITKMEIIN